MNRHLSLCLFALLTLGVAATCPLSGQDTSDPAALADARKIAEAAGLALWPKVESITYTFNSKRGDKLSQRSWIWKPMAREVTAVGEGITYSLDNVTAEAKKVDGRFINDKYWLLFPLHLVWDTGAVLSKSPEKVASPIAGTPMHKLTVQYGSEGGYTPGDAYDVFYGDDYVVREWTFRRGGAAEPTMSTTWEEYQDFSGLPIALQHKNAKGGQGPYFTDVTVTLAK